MSFDFPPLLLLLLSAHIPQLRHLIEKKQIGSLNKQTTALFDFLSSLSLACS
jgi:hypothetical protein